MQETFELSEIMNPGPWSRGWWPHHHVSQRNVFTPSFYAALEEQYREYFAVGKAGGRPPKIRSIGQSIDGYGAWSVCFGGELGGPLSLFGSRAWHDFMCEMFGVVGIGDVNLGAHSHDPGSPNGQVHRDLNPGWFPSPAGPGRVNLAGDNAVRYRDGAVLVPGTVPHKRVRAITAIFYLCNGPWTLGDGGETGLYRDWSSPVDHPDLRVPPIDNSIVAFEVTARSFHSFITNRKPRNTMIMFFHRTLDEAVAMYGADAIKEWS